MLLHLDAVELADWKAYELVEGRLDNSWDREILATILEVLLANRGVKDPRVGRPWKDFTPKKTEEQEEAEKLAAIASLDKALGFEPE